MKTLFIEVLTQFNKFKAGDKVYSQKDGLVMGNSLSPILANIYCHLMEKDVIAPKYGNDVVFYCRYVDDVMAIIKTNALNKIFHEMNNFDNNLKFTLETMNPTLPFLDTEIYLDTNNELQHKFYRKKVASTKLHNYKTAVIPWKYLNSTLCGEIYRRHNTCTNDTDLKKSPTGS